jgi:hypothetical protein
MSQQESGNYTVYHWLGSRSWWTLFPNQLGPASTTDHEPPWKRKLLSDRRFRQALSLAINRPQIVKAFYYDQTDPANDVAGPDSLFHHPAAYSAFTEYDPDRANAILDELGLTQRDSQGYRTYPDGSRMVFRIAYTSWTGLGPGHFVVDDWATVGVRAILKEQARSLFGTQRGAGLHDFFVFEGEGEYRRTDTFSGRIQSRVIDVKPNGTLVLEARKYIQNDDETLEMVLTGLCRAEDVTAANTILSTQLYDLRLVKEHTGELRRSTRKGILTRVFETIFNF